MYWRMLASPKKSGPATTTPTRARRIGGRAGGRGVEEVVEDRRQQEERCRVQHRRAQHRAPGVLELAQELGVGRPPSTRRSGRSTVEAMNSAAPPKAHSAAGSAQRRSHSRIRCRLTAGFRFGTAAYLVRRRQMSNSRDYAVTAIGRDRPGIVAAISAALLEQDCNLEDSHMSILRGHFAVMLIVRAPGRRRARGAGRAPRRRPRGARPRGAHRRAGRRARRSPSAQPTHLLSVYGADRPGIVAGVTAALRSTGRQHHRPLHAAGRRGRLADLRHARRDRPR